MPDQAGDESSTSGGGNEIGWSEAIKLANGRHAPMTEKRKVDLTGAKSCRCKAHAQSHKHTTCQVCGDVPVVREGERHTVVHKGHHDAHLILGWRK